MAPGNYDDEDAFYDGDLYYDEEILPKKRSRMKKKVKLGLSDLNPLEKVELGQRVHTAMTGNAKFPAPNPSLATLEERIGAASAKIRAYENMAEALAAAAVARNTAVADLEDTLRGMGSYVDNVSEGDEEVIRSAAMNVNAPPQRKQLRQVTGLRLASSDSEGEVDSRWDSQGAAAYQVQICTDPATPPTKWVEKLTTTRSRCKLNDTLVSGQRVWVRVRAIGASGEGPWSDPAVKTVP